MTTDQDKCQTIVAGSLRVVFFRRGDRFAHRIELQDGDVWAAVLESIEGDATQAWPPSPPLSQLHIEPRPEGRNVALLVGMAGGNHWSASVESDPASQRLTFDVACRVHGHMSGPLASSYRRLSDKTTGAEVVVTAGLESEVSDKNGYVSVAGLSPPSRASGTFRWTYVVVA